MLSIDSNLHLFIAKLSLENKNRSADRDIFGRCKIVYLIYIIKLVFLVVYKDIVK